MATERPGSGGQCVASEASFGLTAGTVGADRLARDLPFAATSQTAAVHVQPDPGHQQSVEYFL